MTVKENLLSLTTAGGIAASAGITMITTNTDWQARSFGLVLTVIGLVCLGWNAREKKDSDQKVGARVQDEDGDWVEPEVAKAEAEVKQKTMDEVDFSTSYGGQSTGSNFPDKRP